MTANNIILSKNGLVVTIATTGDEENLTKMLSLITYPKSTSNQSTDPTDSDYGPNQTKILDLLAKAEQRITIDGDLVGGAMETSRVIGGEDIPNDSSTTASGRKADLKKIFLGGGVVDLTYEGSTFTIGIDKLSIKRVDFEGADVGDGDVEYTVKFTAIRGINLTS